ncbi:hypothetical protein [Rhizosaccharibacter radicis]|uniref:Uncharacterized protein n=1 Tax=Rhizosaccharibacter radicis TaxID=2782605 RepID=A0ABT1VW26_9PROT|nr:hypothetical protein [Acetobacteraceae bacterium KSS12]
MTGRPAPRAWTSIATMSRTSGSGWVPLPNACLKPDVALAEKVSGRVEVQTVMEKRFSVMQVRAKP